MEGVYAGVLGYVPPWRLAHYVAMADKQGVPRTKLTGAILGDSLHGRIGDGVHVFPPRACLRMIADTMKFVVEEVPLFRACDVQGYSCREAGCTAVQEVAFCIADAIAVIEACLELGLDIDAIAPHITFFFAGYSDFFEEVAKFRAARVVWAKVMRERFRAKKKGSWRMRFMVKTSASTLPAQHPLLNIARSNLQALSAILGGANALFVTAFDESYGSPTEHSARIALLSGKVLEHETGVGEVADPLGGSYYVERLTREMEKAIWDYIEEIDSRGGYVAALEEGYLQREIAATNARYSYNLDSGKHVVVGVNKYEPEGKEEYPIEVFEQDPIRVHRIMTNRLAKLRAERDNGRVQEVLARLKEAASGDGYMAPVVVEASKALCTTSEVYGVFKEVFGEDDQCLIPPQWNG
ncbi:methylmalonyl-CoA mutase family protein [Chloroflexota bacterium]